MAPMEPKSRIDLFGTFALLAVTLLLAFNQVVVKVTNGGLQPVFFAGLRSLGAIFCIWLWIRFRGRRLEFPRDTIRPGLLIGVVFSVEFAALFIALDLTTVTRTSIIFYTMPVWLALMSHFYLSGDAMSPAKAVGLVVALGGMAWALIDRDQGGGQASLWGDLAALVGALAWALTAILARASALRTVHPEMQLFWMVLVSAPILLAVSPLFGELVRDLQPIHLWGLAFQIVFVVSAGFIFWLWLLAVYPPSGVAAFSFLGPVFGVGLGWLLLGEEISISILGALALVAAGLWLINRPAKSAQVPQKV